MKLFLILLTAVIFSTNAYAQDTNGAIDSYEPPPLFGAPKLPPPKIIKPKIDVIDEVSKEVIETKQPRFSKDIKIRPRNVVKEVTESKDNVPATITPKVAPKIIQTLAPKPIPKQKPATSKPPIIQPKVVKEAIEQKTKPTAPKPTDIEKKASKPVLIEEPINLLKQETKPTSPKSTGVVKGPKTMPSYKKKSVEAEETFIQDNAEPINMLERATPKAPPPHPPVIEEPKENVPSTISETQKQFNILYQPNQITPSEAAISGTLKPLARMLADNKKFVEIKSYATLIEGKFNSDRKIALDRGLKAREYLIANGVDMQRINLRSFGKDIDKNSSDSVEITLSDN